MITINPERLKKYVEDNYQIKVIPALIQYIKIDNLSRTYDPQWNTNGKLQKAAQYIVQWVKDLKVEGLTVEIIQDEGYSPLIFTQIQGNIPHTLFFYGHYDKQPPMVGWMEGIGATNPKIINGKLYGRGGADDGYATFSTILAIKALQEQGILLPRCVMITEGDQQSGSGHMPHYLQKLKPRIGQPYAFFCLDSGALDYDRMWLTTSLRGNLVATLKVEANQSALHSGSYSGVIPSVFRILRILLNRIQNSTTGQVNNKFFRDITPDRYRQNQQIAALMGNSVYKHFPFAEGTKPLSQNPLECLLKRNWYPTFTLTGQTGFPPAESAGNVLLPSIQVRFSVRLSPNYPPEQAEATLKQILQTDVPYNAKATVHSVRASGGWSSTQYQPYFQKAITEASELFYGNKLLSMGEGGAIPLMVQLQQMWPGRQFLITGVLGPNSNAHGPNQFLHIDYVKKLTCCLAYVVAKSSEHLQKKQ